MIEPTVKEKEILRRANYDTFWNSELGKWMLDDLMETFGFYRNNEAIMTSTPNPGEAAAYILGVKDVFSHILASTKPLHDDELKESYAEVAQGESYD